MWVVTEFQPHQPSGQGGYSKHCSGEPTSASPPTMTFSGDLGALSAPPKRWRIPCPGPGKPPHPWGICVPMPPTLPSQGSELPCKCLFQARATLTRAICPWHRAGGWHSHCWANPEWNQKQGVPGWELLDCRACMWFTLEPGALPKAWHRAALGLCREMQREGEAACQSPAASAGAFFLPGQP